MVEPVGVTQEGGTGPPGWLKVVAVLREEGISDIGVQASNTDPVLFSVDAAGSLEELLAAIPQLVEEARAVWRERARRPGYVRPAAPATPRPVVAPRVSRPAVRATSTAQAQPAGRRLL